MQMADWRATLSETEEGQADRLRTAERLMDVSGDSSSVRQGRQERMSRLDCSES